MVWQERRRSAARFWLVVGFCALLATGCSSAADTPIVEPATVDDLGPAVGAYDLALTSSGDDQRRVLYRPAPVGLTATYRVSLQHEDADGRSQAVNARLSLVVLVSAADGSAAQIQGTWTGVSATTNGAPDELLQRDLERLNDRAATWWIDGSRVASQVEHDVDLDQLGFESVGLARVLFDVPVLLSRPMPTAPIGVGATWDGIIRGDGGAALEYSAETIAMASDGFEIQFPYVGDGIDSTMRVSGVPGEPFPTERHLEVSGAAGGTTVLRMIAESG